MLRDQILPTLREYFAENGDDLVAAYLFGSTARGEERPDSDVDLGVVLGSHTPPTIAQLDHLAEMQSALCQLLGREVDLISFDAAAPDLVHQAFLDKILVFEGNHDARIEFEVQARNEYFDLLPLLLAYRRNVLRRA